MCSRKITPDTPETVILHDSTFFRKFGSGVKLPSPEEQRTERTVLACARCARSLANGLPSYNRTVAVRLKAWLGKPSFLQSRSRNAIAVRDSESFNPFNKWVTHQLSTSGPKVVSRLTAWYSNNTMDELARKDDSHSNVSQSLELTLCLTRRDRTGISNLWV